MFIILHAKKPENTISQTEKHYKQFIRFITEALIWLKLTIDTGNKIKVEIEAGI